MSRPTLCNSCEDVMTQYGYVYVPGHFFQAQIPYTFVQQGYPTVTPNIHRPHKVPTHAPPSYYQPTPLPPQQVVVKSTSVHLPPPLELPEEDQETETYSYDSESESWVWDPKKNNTVYTAPETKSVAAAPVPPVETKTVEKSVEPPVASPPVPPTVPVPTPPAVEVKTTPVVAKKSSFSDIIKTVTTQDKVAAPHASTQVKAKPFTNIVKTVAKEFVGHGGGEGVEEWDQTEADMQALNQDDGLCKMCHKVAPYHSNQQYCRPCFNSLPFCSQDCGYRTNQKNGLCSHCYNAMKVLCSDCNVRYTIYDSGICGPCYFEAKKNYASAQQYARDSSASKPQQQFKEQQCATVWSHYGKTTKCQNKTTYKYCKECYEANKSTF